MQCKLLGKKSKLKVKPMKGMSAGIDSFGILDNEDGTFSVLGVTGGGNTTDISDVATITVVSSDPSIIAASTTAPTTFKADAVGPVGKADVEVVTTWTDGSKGPFTNIVHGEVKPGPVTGVVVELIGVTPH